jgi:hypothetical protein
MATKTKCCAGNKTIRDLILFPDGEVTPPENNVIIDEDSQDILDEDGNQLISD